MSERFGSKSRQQTSYHRLFRPACPAARNRPVGPSATADVPGHPRFRKQIERRSRICLPPPGTGRRPSSIGVSTKGTSRLHLADWRPTARADAGVVSS
jgi:hypothetical protein